MGDIGLNIRRLPLVSRQGDTKAKAGNSVSTAFGILSIIPQTHAFQIVRHLSLGDVIGSLPSEDSELFRQISIGENARQKTDQTSRLPQRQYAEVRDMQAAARCPFTSTGRFNFNRASCPTAQAWLTRSTSRTRRLVESRSAAARVGYTAVADGKVARVVDGGLGAGAISRTSGTCLNTARCESSYSRYAERDSPSWVRNRPCVRLLNRWLKTGWTTLGAESEILTDDFLKQHAASQRAVQHLCQRELGLQDGLIVAARPAAAVPGRKPKDVCAVGEDWSSRLCGTRVTDCGRDARARSAWSRR